MVVITKDMIIGDIMQLNEGIAPLLKGSGMHCSGCHSSQSETIEQACLVHGIDVDELLHRLNFYMELRENLRK